MTSLSIVERIRLWHEEAIQLVQAIARPLPNWQSPTIDITVGIEGAWGYYTKHDHVCHYDVVLAKLQGEEYRRTIVHEVCHAFTRQEYIDHGPLWSELMRAVGEDPAVRCGLPSLSEMYKRLSR